MPCSKPIPPHPPIRTLILLHQTLLLRTLLLILLIHLLMIPLLTVGVLQLRLLVVEHGLLPQDQKQEEETILDRSRGLHLGEWTEIVDLHHRLLVMDDEIGMMTIVVRTAVNENKIGIGIGVLLPRVDRLLRLRLPLVGRDRWSDLHRRIISRDVMRPHEGGGRLLRLRLPLVGRDMWTDLQCRIISRDVMHPCMKDEMKMYVVKEEVGIGVERETEGINVVAAKRMLC